MIKKLLIVFVICFCAGVAMAAGTKSVYYNTKSYIYHKHSCEWAVKCTKNCITIDINDARSRGGRPCKVCGG